MVEQLEVEGGDQCVDGRRRHRRATATARAARARWVGGRRRSASLPALQGGRVRGRDRHGCCRSATAARPTAGSVSASHSTRNARADRTLSRSSRRASSSRSPGSAGQDPGIEQREARCPGRVRHGRRRRSGSRDRRPRGLATGLSGARHRSTRRVRGGHLARCRVEAHGGDRRRRCRTASGRGRRRRRGSAARARRSRSVALVSGPLPGSSTSRHRRSGASGVTADQCGVGQCGQGEPERRSRSRTATRRLASSSTPAHSTRTARSNGDRPKASVTRSRPPEARERVAAADGSADRRCGVEVALECGSAPPRSRRRDGAGWRRPSASRAGGASGASRSWSRHRHQRGGDGPDALRVTGLWAPSTCRATPYWPAGSRAEAAGRGTETVVVSASEGVRRCWRAGARWCGPAARRWPAAAPEGQVAGDRELVAVTFTLIFGATSTPTALLVSPPRGCSGSPTSHSWATTTGWSPARSPVAVANSTRTEVGGCRRRPG